MSRELSEYNYYKGDHIKCADMKEALEQVTVLRRAGYECKAVKDDSIGWIALITDYRRIRR